MNQVQLLGRTTREIELRYTNNGSAIARFTLAVDKPLSREKRQEYEAKNKNTTDFISCVAYGKIAETISKYVKKGNRLLIIGSINTGKYQKNNNTIYTTDVLVSRINLIENNKNKKQNIEENKEYTPYFNDFNYFE